ncbi:MAG: UDP-N-acetylglucosamine--N-acetylmuramyl-(pentapeptide) pyrophosphoryl-undecaprenol N-acetylglucosamine transferase [Chloroflexi bacterium]|jgi:UDP-N-acetylglucosamine--N-acetylmuramyl-(pentapeptide) pyrophosphoryl-undecaprenol N-acetylglucosamine transferase|nr:UDP-N-acetylglucosamine--N-acetylmuramyl-(pentapeptide) pyrophosphoryl-undecaprenol N-acetylglucosamine transferase [Chloroflexota bacterium]
MRVLIAGGGTGGHIYPALAVARSLRARPDPPELAWVGGHRGLEGGLVPPSGIPLDRLVLRSLRTVDRDVHLVLDPLRLAASVPQAAALLARSRPAAIFTTGGYVAIPVMLAARPLGIPVVLWEGNAIPGRSVRATARLGAAVAVSFEETCGALRVARCYRTGTPIRDPGAIDRAAARSRLGIPPEAHLLLVFGGSQAVRRFSLAVTAALPRLVERAWVLHVTGDAGYPGALADRESLPTPLRERYRPVAFLADEMADALAAADLLVGRAGSSTLAEAAAFGLPLVCVPYPHAAGHQRANARLLVEAGAARLVADEAFDADALLAAAALLDDPAMLAAMRAAALAEARPGAADALATLVLAAAARQPWPGPDEVECIARGTT